jgi:NAD(P)-dependent dehydrogenase (short-subunit alcohol dehydrogenase family)
VGADDDGERADAVPVRPASSPLDGSAREGSDHQHRLAKLAGQHRDRVNAVSPTLVVTPLFTGMPADEQAADREKAKRQPIPRLGLPSDVALAVSFFAADEAEFITGQHLYVGGGADLMMSTP